MSEMERDLINRRRGSSYFCGCYMMSPSCFPVHEELDYSRIHHCSSGGDNRTRRRWRNLLRRLVKDGKTSLYGSKPPLSFHYDAVSYSQNFDEGCHRDESAHRRRVFQECSYIWPANLHSGFLDLFGDGDDSLRSGQNNLSGNLWSGPVGYSAASWV
ncbi:hypothetical protein Goklo_020905, partial [Gossypium klotzschianum]|nr:hypothetical protein [Gossypium klotzschianum]